MTNPKNSSARVVNALIKAGSVMVTLAVGGKKTERVGMKMKLVVVRTQIRFPKA